MFERQPAHVRRFLWVIASVGLVLLILLLLIARRTVVWVPPDDLTMDTLVPADEGQHYTPDTLTLRPITTVVPVASAVPYTMRWRVGVGVPDQELGYFNWPNYRPGWFLNWTTNLEYDSYFFGLFQRTSMIRPAAVYGVEFVPMVRMRNGRIFPDTDTLHDLARQNPGLTWLIGNEPDVLWQDNTPPEIYAIAYHRAHTAIKGGDPTAKVAIGGLSQITPLRLHYLDRIWDFYRSLYGTEIPVDIWTMHAFVLREARQDWGVNIPPGFAIPHHGELWSLEDHDDLALVEEQVRAMRLWMARHGQKEKPLWITEYGILMPEEYGFPPERVIRFMEGSFDLFTALRDPALGFGQDDDRLVQRWTWYSARDSRYATGNLFDNWGEPTAIGRAFTRYLETHLGE